jgi:hypothetical protein
MTKGIAINCQADMNMIKPLESRRVPLVVITFVIVLVTYAANCYIFYYDNQDIYYGGISFDLRESRTWLFYIASVLVLSFLTGAAMRVLWPQGQLYKKFINPPILLSALLELFNVRFAFGNNAQYFLGRIFGVGCAALLFALFNPDFDYGKLASKVREKVRLKRK